jgi:serine/threonine protein kinase
MVRKDGVLKLMDFGVAQVVDLERMTVTGQILGSPAYMAPEVLDGRTLDFRSDVFSVGVMLYQMATGALPFPGKNPHEVLRKVSEGKFADPRTVNRLVSDQLARVIAKAMARKPEDRFATIQAMVDELRAYAADAGLGTAEGRASHLPDRARSSTRRPSFLGWFRRWSSPACANRRPNTARGRSSCGIARSLSSRTTMPC